MPLRRFIFLEEKMSNTPSLEPVVSRIAYDSIEEKPSYTGQRAKICAGDKVLTCLELDKQGRLLINGSYSDTPPVLPKKADKIVLY